MAMREQKKLHQMSKNLLATLLRDNVRRLYGNGTFNRRIIKKASFHLKVAAQGINPSLEGRARTIIKDFLADCAWRKETFNGIIAEYPNEKKVHNMMAPSMSLNNQRLE